MKTCTRILEVSLFYPEVQNSPSRSVMLEEMEKKMDKEFEDYQGLPNKCDHIFISDQINEATSSGQFTMKMIRVVAFTNPVWTI